MRRTLPLSLMLSACTIVATDKLGDTATEDTDPALDTDGTDPIEDTDDTTVDTDDTTVDTDDTTVDTDDTTVDTDDTTVDTDDTDVVVETDETDLPLAPAAGELVVVEIQGNPQGANDEQAEYIEVMNVSGRTLDLQGIRVAYVQYPASGGAPTVSTGVHTISGSVMVSDGDRVLLQRSSGGYFGSPPNSATYSGFVFSNSDTTAARLRLYGADWNGTEPPAPADLLDEVTVPAATFDNDLRGRAWQLKPSAGTPTAALNDVPSNWCTTAESGGLQYWGSNWGTPGDANDCS